MDVDQKGQSPADQEVVTSEPENTTGKDENQDVEEPKVGDNSVEEKLAAMEKKVGLLIKESAKYRIRAKEASSALQERERISLEEKGEYQKANEILKKSLEAERAERTKLKTQFTAQSIKKQTIAELAKKGAVDPESVFKTLDKESIMNVEVSDSFEVDIQALAGIVDTHAREKPYFFKSNEGMKTAPAKPGSKVVQKEVGTRNWKENAHEIADLLDGI